jgi:hypothetical protein
MNCVSNICLSGILLCGNHCQYSLTAALPVPLQKPYMKYIATYSSFENVNGTFTGTFSNEVSYNTNAQPD